VWFAGKVFGVHAVVRYLRSPNPGVTVRLLQAFGAAIGRRTTFKGGVRFDNVYEDFESAGNFRHLTIGDNCYIGDDVFLDMTNPITLEADVILSARATILTHADCNRSPRLQEVFPRVSRAVHIGTGAWIGAGAIILPGADVGREAVVAAGAVLTEPAAAAALYAGCPARKVRELDLPPMT
jgi:acetyltransferase-like isoleucine patch superfamily enzyme